MAAADLTKTEAVDKVESLSKRLSNLRRKSREKVVQAQRLGGMVAGGALSGYLQVKMPFIPGTQTDSGKVAGGLMAVVALSGFIDDDSVNEFILGMAGGTLAAEACDATRNFMLQAPQANQPNRG